MENRWGPEKRKEQWHNKVHKHKLFFYLAIHIFTHIYTNFLSALQQPTGLNVKRSEFSGTENVIGFLRVSRSSWLTPRSPLFKFLQVIIMVFLEFRETQSRHQFPPFTVGSKKTLYKPWINLSSISVCWNSRISFVIKVKHDVQWMTGHNGSHTLHNNVTRDRRKNNSNENLGFNSYYFWKV